MNKALEELQLGESYRFSVVVENNGTHFAGDLSLSPEGCTLVVRGDVLEGRSPTFEWYEVDELKCTSFSSTFILSGLKGAGGSSRTLQRHPESIGHFEIQYAIAHVIFQRGQMFGPEGYVGFKLHSQSIARWIGTTTTQHAIAAASDKNTLLGQNLPINAEFQVHMPDLGIVMVTYEISMGYMRDFSVGIHFPPVLSVFFDTTRSVTETISIIKEVDALFSFLLGYPLVSERIQLITPFGGHRPSSLYVAAPRNGATNFERRYPFFPLGHNLSHDQLGLPPLPIDVFPTYMGLPDNDRAFIKKYLWYRHLDNPEERFLGFFRLLEKLCYQNESFLPHDKLQCLLTRATPFLIKYFNDAKNVRRVIKRMDRLNRSKLDTAGCIKRFMDALPAMTLERWTFGARDLEAICKLRNDLTHANELEPDTSDIAKKAKFIEALLVIRLLVHIGVQVADASSISGRLQHHDLIERRNQVSFDVPPL
jgi:hypothetical protein